MAFVQAATPARFTTPAQSSLSTSFPASNGAGNCLIAMITWSGVASILTGFTDNLGNAWTQVGSSIYDATDGQAAAVYIAFNCASGTPTMTATFYTGMTFVGIVAGEFSNADAIDIISSQAAANTTAANNVTSGSATTTTNGDQIVGLITNIHSAAVITAGTSPNGFTIPSGGATTSSPILGFEYMTTPQTSAGSIAATATIGTAGRYIAFMVALRTTNTPAVSSTSVTVDALGAGPNYQANNTSLSWTHACGGNYRFLVVGIAVGYTSGGTRTTGVTYNGVAMTSLGKVYANNSTPPGAGFVEMFYMVAPPVGSYTVAVSASPSSSLVGRSVSFIGVDQTTPYTDLTTSYGNSATASITVPSNFGNMVIDAVCAGTNITGATGTNQTLQWSTNGNTLSDAGNGAQSTNPGKLSVTNSYSMTSDFWGMIAINIRSVNMYNRPILTAVYQNSRDYNTTATPTGASPKVTTLTTSVGDYIAVYCGGESNADVLSAPVASNGLTFVLQQSIVLSGRSTAYIYTTQDTIGGTWTISMTDASTSTYWGLTALVFTNTSGFCNSGQANNAGSLISPALWLSTSASRSGIITFNVDQSANDTSTNANYAVNSNTPTVNNAQVLNVGFQASHYGWVGCYYYDAGTAGIKGLGMSSPTNQTYSFVALEVLPPGISTGVPTAWIYM